MHKDIAQVTNEGTKKKIKNKLSHLAEWLEQLKKEHQLLSVPLLPLAFKIRNLVSLKGILHAQPIILFQKLSPFSPLPPLTMTRQSKPWRPFTANCCSAEDQTIFGNFSRCRPSRSEFSKNIAPLPSFRKLSYSDLSRSSSTRINEDLAQSFGSELYDFQLSELRAITQNFSSNFLLGEGGFGTVHKGYVDENLRQGLKAQAVAVKLLDIEGLQGHREWLVSISPITQTILTEYCYTESHTLYIT